MKIQQIGGLDEKAYLPTVIPGIFCINLSAPIAVQYEINGGCNERCVFCYNIWKSSKKVDPISKTVPREKRKEIINKIISLDVFQVILSGGEPLLAPDICDVVSQLSGSKIRTHLITNGTLLTNELTKGLRSAGLGGIQISLHGSSPEIHDSITQKPGSFVKTIAGIKRAVEILGPESINVNMVLVDKNHNDVEPTIIMLKGIANLSFSLSFLSETGLALSADVKVGRKQIIQSFRTMVKAGRKCGLDVGIVGGFPLCLFPKTDQGLALQLSANVCDAGLNQLVISPNGDIRSCVCMPQTLGNILVDDPKEIWGESPFLQFLRRFEHVPTQCYSCDLVAMCKGGCRAAAYCVYGDFGSIDPIIKN